ncbi:MAG: prepilin-type N-terminal cleavage/methylation domain-containing protein [Thermodesulfobacteriota bacterium]
MQEPFGFTLVELLMVVAIIAVLAAIAIPAFTKHKMRAYKAALDADAKNVYTAAQAYLSDYTQETMDSLAKLNAGGFQKTFDVVFVDGSLSLTGGNIELYSNILNAQGKDNNSVIFYDAVIEFVNAP